MSLMGDPDLINSLLKFSIDFIKIVSTVLYPITSNYRYDVRLALINRLPRIFRVADF